MHPYLLEFRLPLIFKTLFTLAPIALHIMLVIGGIALMFFPEPAKPENQTDDAAKAQAKKNYKVALITFWTGLACLVIGMIGIGVNVLVNDKVEGEAWARLAAVSSRMDTPQAMTEIGDNGRLTEDSQIKLSKLNSDLIGLTSSRQRGEFAETQAAERATALYEAIQPFYKPMRAVATTDDPVAHKLPTGAERDAAMAALTAAWNAARQKPVDKDLPLAPVKLPAYGVMIMLGFIGAITLMYIRSRIDGTDPNVVIDIGIVAMIFGILGARVWHVIEYWDAQYGIEGRSTGEALWEAMQVQKGGLVFYGGFIFASFAIWAYLRIRKLPILYYLDMAAVVVPLGHAFGRIGCFLNGCCWGVACPADHPLATAYGHALSRGNGEIIHVAGSPVLMSQFVSSALAMTLFILLTIFYDKLARFRGEVSAMLVALYGVNRLLNQGLRADVPTYDGWGSSQWLSVVAIVGGLAVWAYFRFVRKNRTPMGQAGLQLDRAKAVAPAT